MIVAATSHRQRHGASLWLSYALPIAVGILLCAWTMPAQFDRLAEDEVREAERAFALAHGEAGLLDTWAGGLHPPMVSGVAALSMKVLPTPLALRVLGLLLGLLTIPLVIALGRRTGRGEIGLVAGLMVASSPVWWAYASSLSLDLPLAGFTALAAYACIGPRKNLALAVVALVGAGLTKRLGLPTVVVAMLLAFLAGTRTAAAIPRKLVSAGILLAVAGMAWVATELYTSGGGRLLGTFDAAEDFVASSWLFLGCAVVTFGALAVNYWRTAAADRSVVHALLLFTLPLLIAPLVAARPIPRYFLPALPTAAVLGAAAIWWWGGASRATLRWVASIALIASSAALQGYDLHKSYWPRQRGHRDAIAWLAEHVPPTAVILAPEAPFLQIAAQQAGVTTAELINIDRTTCARLEGRLATLATAQRPAWVVLPLYRDLGWLGDLEEHAAAMGLQLRALVRRDVARGTSPASWQTIQSESIGDAAGVPVIAILSSVRQPDLGWLGAPAQPTELFSFADGLSARNWRHQGVAVRSAPGGGVEVAFNDHPIAAGIVAVRLPFLDTFSTIDWHHHSWLELQVQADDDALEHLRIGVGLRNTQLRVPLSQLQELPAIDGWRRLAVDLRSLPIEELSFVRWLRVTGERVETGDQKPRLVLRRFRLLPETAELVPATGGPPPGG